MNRSWFQLTISAELSECRPVTACSCVRPAPTACSPLPECISNMLLSHWTGMYSCVSMCLWFVAFDCDSSASASPCSGLQPASWSLFPPCACWYTHLIHPPSTHPSLSRPDTHISHYYIRVNCWSYNPYDFNPHWSGSVQLSSIQFSFSRICDNNKQKIKNK